MVLKLNTEAIRTKPRYVLPGSSNGLLPILSQQRLRNRALFAARQGNQPIGVISQDTRRQDGLALWSIMPCNRDQAAQVAPTLLVLHEECQMSVIVQGEFCAKERP